MRDIVDCLRPRTVPPGYNHHTWIEGMYIQCIYIHMYLYIHSHTCTHALMYTHTHTSKYVCLMPNTYGLYDSINVGKLEGFEDKLRSLLAQFHYTYEIRKLEAQETPFNVYMYVPEHHPETNDVFFEREDEAHLIKVILFVYMLIT